jgi:rhodanese-related sulfurtransferase
MILHELYFASMGGDGKPTPKMAEVLANSFGSAERWRAEFMAMAAALSGGSLQFIDARPRHYVSRVQDIVEGTTWRDPDRIDSWISELKKEEPVVVFCAYGYHVGCKTAIALREAGFDAKYMTSGHSG